MKDWVGNKNSIFKTLGASNHTEKDREIDDYYATEPKAVRLLTEIEKLHFRIWEPACGEGHLSEELKRLNFEVYSTDLIDRGYGDAFFDFLTCTNKDYGTYGWDHYNDYWFGDIVTNPPYKNGLEFIQKALSVVRGGHKVCMFMKVQFLEGQKRGQFFKGFPPKVIHVSSSRLLCAKNGNFDEMIAGGGSAVAYAWWVWQKGYQGDTVIKWFN
jgi:hypothetical protein